MLLVFGRNGRAGVAWRWSARRFGSDTGRDLLWNTAGVNRHGFPWPPDCTEASLDFAERWQPGPRDVFVSTYPKSGTTWMLHLVYQLASQGDFDFAAFHDVHPFWEAAPDVHCSLDASRVPRVIKTHASLIPQFVNGTAKVIYVHLQWDSSFPSFFEKFMAGQLYYGSWFDHAVDALQYPQHPRMLFLSYEAMQKDLRAVLQTVMEFTGYHVAPDVLEQAIMPRLGFKFMKEHDAVFDFTLKYPTRRKDGSFFRKGKEGDHKNYLSGEQLQRMREKYTATLHNQLPYQL